MFRKRNKKSCISTHIKTFYCYTYTSDSENRFVFISEEGKILAYQSVTENYTSSGNLVNDFTIGGMSSSSSAHISGEKSDCLGLIYLKAKARTSNDDKAGCIICTVANNTFGNSTEPYYGKEGHTSAIKVTEVTGYTTNAAQNLAIAKIEAKLHIAANASKLGDEIGTHYYLIGNDKTTDVAVVNTAIDNATNIFNVNAVLASIRYVVPQQGVPYSLFDASHSVYLDIHNRGAEQNYLELNQMATLNATPQSLYITGNPVDGSWKIHTQPYGGEYLCQYTGGKQTWDSWVSADASEYYWDVELVETNEGSYFMLKNTGSAGGYLGCGDHLNGKPLYSNQTGDNEKLKLQLIKNNIVVNRYRPTTRAKALVSDRKYMIYNTAFDGTEDRTGFLYDNGSALGHSGSPKKKPADYRALDNALWEVIGTDEEGKYYLRAADGGYVNATGKTDNQSPVALYIQPWESSTDSRHLFDMDELR